MIFKQLALLLLLLFEFAHATPVPFENSLSVYSLNNTSIQNNNGSSEDRLSSDVVNLLVAINKRINENHDDQHADEHGADGDHGDSHSDTESHGNNNEHGETGEHGNGAHGEHHVPPPSFQLSKHTFSYKPEGFEMFSRSAGLKKTIVGFKYPTTDSYDRFLIRVRFHGYDEYATNKMKINKTDENYIVLKEFIDAQYVVCVTLFSSSGLPQYPPISTSDMCMDLTIGKSHPIGGHHSSTGLLSPLLVAVAAVLLFIIAVGNSIIRCLHKRNEKKEKQREREDRNKEHDKLSKSPTEKRFDSALNDPNFIPKWQAAAFLCRLVENDSRIELNEINNLIYYANKAYQRDHDETDEKSRNKAESPRNINSLDTVKHLLNDKPWLKNESPKFYLKQ